MHCYISKNYKGLNSAGNKAKTDIEQIMRKHRFKNVGLSQTQYNNSIIGFLITLAGVIKAIFCIQKGDELVLQYPLKKYYTFLCVLTHLKRGKVITVIHDLGSFRRQKLTVSQEIKRLNQSDYIIAHNPSMKKWLEEQGIKTKIGCLEIFDYLSATTAPARSLKDTFDIVYAGGLSERKNNFLYKWKHDTLLYRVNLYGSGFIAENTESPDLFSYKGFIPSDQLIAESEGNFGLVWDGDSLTECSGEWGEYLKYNNPHKTSLYIRCHLPIIIWQKAALAPFIENNKIGITINSISELNQKLSEITPEKYDELIENCKNIDEKIRNGHYILKALETAIQEI
ncbi:galactofuranosyltransferase [Porphyromonadaceae bacterium OttesenSCG-928-L07]|nr:galactofuranosyltransferase [Porphyromonadaceae bacterium OttesenSCG-928-L07]MDL2251261.1 galactofuranosyltransferase [Odoribacter sp. OttesenSCG-928-J03]